MLYNERIRKGGFYKKISGEPQPAPMTYEKLIESSNYFCCALKICQSTIRFIVKLFKMSKLFKLLKLLKY